MARKIQARKVPEPARVELVPIAALCPNPKNPRKHSRGQIKRLAAIIREIGIINPISVDENMMILAGHGRREAARLAGLTVVPIIRYDHLTPEQKRAYVLADNRIAEQAGWDRDLLAIEFAEIMELLPAAGLDVTLTGFEVGEIDLLLADMSSSPPAREDVLPPPQRGGEPPRRPLAARKAPLTLWRCSRSKRSFSPDEWRVGRRGHL